MMKNRFIRGRRVSFGVILAALAGLTVGCADDVRDAQNLQEVKDAPTAVVFGAQALRGTTRAGTAGAMTTASLQSGVHSTDGFGVFSYYSNNSLYNGLGHPDFMYNQQVSYDSGELKWSYTPQKYWPNEFGADAQSTSTDRLSFFAYAPWVETTKLGSLTSRYDNDPTDASKSTRTGIVGVSGQVENGDPYLYYVTSWIPEESVDLLWGTGDDGLPILNASKAAVNEKVIFSMRHALASLNLQVDSREAVDADTRIWIRRVRISGVAGEGTLCLNNTVAAVPKWHAYGCHAPLPESGVTLYDGRRDGLEGVSDAGQMAETPQPLNPVLVQSASYSEAYAAGVTSTPVNLLSSISPTSPVYVIPTGAPLSITIDYDVETRANVGSLLADGVTRGSVIANSITASRIFSTMQSGKAYTVALHLGASGVQFDAAVSEWDDAALFSVVTPN